MLPEPINEAQVKALRSAFDKVKGPDGEITADELIDILNVAFTKGEFGIPLHFHGGASPPPFSWHLKRVMSYQQTLASSPSAPCLQSNHPLRHLLLSSSSISPTIHTTTYLLLDSSANRSGCCFCALVFWKCVLF